MSFDFNVFFKAVKLSFTKRPLTFRRVWVMSIFLTAYPITTILVRLGMLIDNIFFPGYRNQKVKEPFFIMGNPRSGTTFMQTTFALDEETFTHLTLYDILIPSISVRKFIKLLEKIDNFIFRGILAKGVHKIEGFIFHGIGNIHPMALRRPEEDAILIHTFISAMILLLFPFPEELGYILMIDNFDEKDKKKHIKFYEKSIKRHVYNSGGKKLLSKNTLLIGCAKTMIELFPDAKIVYIIRNPYEAIASLQSMMYTFWRLPAPEIEKNSPELRKVAEIAINMFKYANELTKELPPERLMVVKYEDFLSKPKEIVEKVYKWLGIEMSETFIKKLDEKLSEERKFKSKHKYSQDEFGITRKEIYEELKEIFEKYNWPSQLEE